MIRRTKSCPERIETYPRSPWYAAILNHYCITYPGIVNRIEYFDDEHIMSILEFNTADQPKMREIEDKVDEIIAATSRYGARREDVILLVWGEFEHRGRIRMQEVLDLVPRRDADSREALIKVFEKNIQDLRPRCYRKRKRGGQEFAIPDPIPGRRLSTREPSGSEADINRRLHAEEQDEEPRPVQRNHQ